MSRRLGGSLEFPDGTVQSTAATGAPMFMRLAANAVSTNTTLAPNTLTTVFTSPSLAAGTWTVELEGLFTSAAATTGLVIGYGHSVAPTSAAISYLMGTAAATVQIGGSIATTGTAAAPTLFTGTGSGATAPLPVRLRGSFVLAAAATFTVVMRSEVGSSAATILAGAHLELRKAA